MVLNHLGIRPGEKKKCCLNRFSAEHLTRANIRQWITRALEQAKLGERDSPVSVSGQVSHKQTLRPGSVCLWHRAKLNGKFHCSYVQAHKP